jgi:creatinine amidohydrolase
MERRMQYMNWIDFKKLIPKRIKTVILPIGTIEAHGVIPLGTDNIIPEEIALEIAEKIDAVICPHTELWHYPFSPALSRVNHIEGKDVR